MDWKAWLGGPDGIEYELVLRDGQRAPEGWSVTRVTLPDEPTRPYWIATLSGGRIIPVTAEFFGNRPSENQMGDCFAGAPELPQTLRFAEDLKPDPAWKVAAATLPTAALPVFHS